MTKSTSMIGKGVCLRCFSKTTNTKVGAEGRDGYAWSICKNYSATGVPTAPNLSVPKPGTLK